MQNINPNHLTTLELNILLDYTLGRSELLNKSIWQYNVKKTFDCVKYDVNIIQQLNNIIGKANPLKQELIVYSGVSDIRLRKHYSQYTKNSQIHIPSFVSSSIKEEVAKKFTKKRNGIILKIHLPENFKNGVYIKDFSEHPEEDEFLIGCNNIFTVTGIEKIKDITYITVHHSNSITDDYISIKNLLEHISSIESVKTKLHKIQKATSAKTLVKYVNDTNITVLRAIMTHSLFSENILKQLLENDAAIHYLHFIKSNKHITLTDKMKRLINN